MLLQGFGKCFSVFFLCMFLLGFSDFSGVGVFWIASFWR